MPQAVIDNPVINSPFVEPLRHFRFNDDGITDQIDDGRRSSSYFIPIPRPKKKGKDAELNFGNEWTQDRIKENDFVNRIRARVSLWRSRDQLASTVTRTTQRLLEYWQNPDREKKLFFCQIEALETVIYLTEVAHKTGDDWLDNLIEDANQEANPGLLRIACKMATGAGKTVVMGMIVAWQALNKIANPQDARFADAFLFVTPGITIRDRLRVLLPNDPECYYRKLDLVPPDLLHELDKAKFVITNFHSFKRREKFNASKLTKEILTQGGDALLESEGEMVRRVCRGLGNKRNIIVLNDEAHHCYRHKVDGVEDELSGDERKEAQQREESARIWISGLEAVRRKTGIKALYDLSATPFFLRGSGYSEGILFPWVVSDFSLIDAIESGIVKVPRVPVADNAMTGQQPFYRDLWLRIRDDLPKKGRGSGTIGGEPKLPVVLEGALRSLYENYERYNERWLRNADAKSRGQTPPVFIVVCNNTNVSKLVFDYIGGWEKELPNGNSVAVPGKLPLFSNVKDGRFSNRPNTILVDSEQLESGESMSADFKKFASREIDEFKAEYRRRYPDRDPDKLTDEDLLREVLNTVGKPDKLGEQIKCVVSVSMLTEGWDANTVTHILGVRAFGTQLLCEQVVGRGLRRTSYAPAMQSVNVNGKPVEFLAFPAEYAEVYGVPFSFIPCSGSAKDPKPGPAPTRVRAIPDRAKECEITFPRIDGYRYEVPDGPLRPEFGAGSKFVLTTAHVPTKTENAPIVGASSIHTLDDLKSRRLREVSFLIAKLVLEKYFRADGETKTEAGHVHKFESEVQLWRFPEVLQITDRWLNECVTCKDDTFPQLLLLVQHAHSAADKIYQSIIPANAGPKHLLPIPKSYDTIGSTRHVDFDTVKPTMPTRPDRCHLSHVVADTESWEQKLAQTLEDDDMKNVICYVKNDQHLGLAIPYTVNGDRKNYLPDFIVKIDDGHGRADPLNLILEVTGDQDQAKKQAKVATAKTLWVPAVNNAGDWGRWAYLEITDPWNAKKVIQEFLATVRR